METVRKNGLGATLSFRESRSALSNAVEGGSEGATDLTVDEVLSLNEHGDERRGRLDLLEQ